MLLRHIFLFLALLMPATAIARDFSLVWTDNSTNENGFSLERKCTGEAAFRRIGEVPANVTTYMDPVPENPAVKSFACTYRVQAYNGGGSSPYSNEATGTVETAVPATPTQLKVGLPQ